MSDTPESEYANEVVIKEIRGMRQAFEDFRTDSVEGLRRDVQDLRASYSVYRRVVAVLSGIVLVLAILGAGLVVVFVQQHGTQQRQSDGQACLRQWAHDLTTRSDVLAPLNQKIYLGLGQVIDDLAPPISNSRLNKDVADLQTLLDTYRKQAALNPVPTAPSFDC